MKDNVPSVTALKVAIMIVIMGGDEYGRSKCPPGSVDAQLQLLKACRLPFFYFPFITIQNPIFIKLARWWSSLILPQAMESVGMRKCYMYECVRNALNDGNTRQVLIVGAGYDTLTWSLSQEYPSVEFWEVDHPATSRVKQEGLQTMGQPSNLHTIAADLTQTTLEQILSQRDEYNIKNKTVVVMEGLLYYLDGNEVKGLFASVAKVVGPSSTICFDFFGRDENGRLELGWATPLLVNSIKLTGEPWKWGIDPRELPAFFQETPWTVIGAPKSIGIERLATVQLDEK